MKSDTIPNTTPRTRGTIHPFLNSSLGGGISPGALSAYSFHIHESGTVPSTTPRTLGTIHPFLNSPSGGSFLQGHYPLIQLRVILQIRHEINCFSIWILFLRYNLVTVDLPRLTTFV